MCYSLFLFFFCQTFVIYAFNCHLFCVVLTLIVVGLFAFQAKGVNLFCLAFIQVNEQTNLYIFCSNLPKIIIMMMMMMTVVMMVMMAVLLKSETLLILLYLCLCCLIKLLTDCLLCWRCNLIMQIKFILL